MRSCATTLELHPDEGVSALIVLSIAVEYVLILSNPYVAYIVVKIPDLQFEIMK